MHQIVDFHPYAERFNRGFVVGALGPPGFGFAPAEIILPTGCNIAEARAVFTQWRDHAVDINTTGVVSGSGIDTPGLDEDAEISTIGDTGAWIGVV